LASWTADWVSAWDQLGEACRVAFAQLIGASPETIALVPSVSVGVGTVAATLTAGDEIIVPDDEFTSVLFPLLVVERERGVQVESYRSSVSPRASAATLV